MKVQKKLISSMLSLALLTLPMIGCSSNKASTDTSDKVYKIGISQIGEHPALDSTREGFLEALAENGIEEGKNLEVDYQNALGDVSTSQQIASKLAKDKNDLLFAISTQSAQSVVNAADSNTPVIFTAVTNPVAAGLLKDPQAPEGNVTGASDELPIENAVDLINQLVPNTKKVAALYNTSEVNSVDQVNDLKEALKSTSIEIVEVGVTAGNEINAAINSVVGKVDCLWIPTDNLVTENMALVAKTALDKKLPVIGSEETAVKNGCLAANGLSYKDIGREAGKMAAQVLKGEKKISEIPVYKSDKTTIIINSNTLKALGIEKPTSGEITYVE
ncbi:MAG: ABC transporter substrate-binding protein [Clostridioides sp.]|jgi:putative ABC transport system substrate-binding protein|nr:ABC transporter substrate-binding protein [Clostridioides sp.]